MRNGAVFPWRGDNRFELLVDGATFFPRMLDAIATAQRQVELELYLVEDGLCFERLREALVAAARRGVRVRCLFDSFGCLKLSPANRQVLVDAGVELRLYNPLRWRRGLRNLFRDHRKILLVDDQFGYVGGTGATDEFWNPDNPQDSWHEVMVEMRGPLLDDWRSLFEFQWRRCGERRFWRPVEPLLPARLPAAPAKRSGLGRLAYAAARQHRDILRALLRALGQSRRQVLLATPYFLPTRNVRRALMKAARRGIDVRLLLSGQRTDHPAVRYAGHRYYPRLLRAGVRIFEYQPRFLHAKMVLVDDWVSIGSCNFDHWNLRWNLEANLEAFDPPLGAAVAGCFAQDFAQSKEITLADFQNRPLPMRLYQRLWGWLDRIVINLLDQRRD
jgi:phosphatidylserine/phosphatidylglycerophosphate/cardiolipin synthase-like enzyme